MCTQSCHAGALEGVAESPFALNGGSFQKSDASHVTRGKRATPTQQSGVVIVANALWFLRGGLVFVLRIVCGQRARWVLT